MKDIINRKSLAQAYAASLETRLAMARWSGRPEAMPQAAWRRQRQVELEQWLVHGGFAGAAAPSETKTAANGRRSLASQRDSDEEYKFTQLRIRDAAA
ncbi:hypothetical protein [Pseudoduganella sp. OTU4001]|uniref:hypothetical protein n=1 Tax=Pseudoduganella sp. OTU4001 TaxID=3043854 RepID=UPI00313BF5A0